MDIKNDKLTGADISFKASPNHGGAFATGLPDTLVIHFTAGASLSSSVASLCNPTAKASAHVVVGRDGTIVQLVPFDTVAWHAGASTWADRHGLNKFSIGIEIDNAGRLTQTASGDFLTWFGKRVAKKDAIQGMHRNETTPSWWHAYTQEQIDAVFELCALLASEYPIDVLVGHEEIAPGRKSDPGPAFPLDRLRERILGPGRIEDAPAAVPLVTASLSPTVLGAFAVSGSGKPDSGGDGKSKSGGNGKLVTGGSGKPDIK